MTVTGNCTFTLREDGLAIEYVFAPDDAREIADAILQATLDTTSPILTNPIGRGE